MTENLFYKILSSALREDQTLKKVSFDLTWTNPVVEVKSYVRVFWVIPVLLWYQSMFDAWGYISQKYK